jgi:pimeloyl-ACP methyl ester carboxylesterase
MSMQQAATEVLAVAYEAGGPEGAPVVLLLHGWPDDVRGWRDVAPRLHAAGFRTVPLTSGGPDSLTRRVPPRSLAT